MIGKVEEAMTKCNEDRLVCEKDREEALKEIGNIVHDDVPVHDDEVSCCLAI